MKPWAQRPVEEANLLNPAFCCVTLTSAVVGYTDIDKAGMPYPLSFIILPIVLHKETRESLPRTIRTSMATWLQENMSARVLFPERTISLKPYTREAILFALLHDWLSIGTGGKLQTTKNNADVDRFLRRLGDEARDCIKRGRFVGKWFASAGSVETVMALWGIRP